MGYPFTFSAIRTLSYRLRASQRSQIYINLAKEKMRNEEGLIHPRHDSYDSRNADLTQVPSRRFSTSALISLRMFPSELICLERVVGIEPTTFFDQIHRLNLAVPNQISDALPIELHPLVQTNKRTFPL